MSLLIVALLFLEAWYEAKNGDKRHWVSLVASMGIVATVGYWTGENMIDLGMRYVAGRTLFDLAYNRFKGLKWSYLGKTAWTDRMLRKFNPPALYFLRVLISFLLVFLLGTHQWFDLAFLPWWWFTLSGIAKK